MGSGLVVSFPVQQTNRSINISTTTDIGNLLTSNPYSFIFWQYFDILAVYKGPLCSSSSKVLLTLIPTSSTGSGSQLGVVDQPGGPHRVALLSVCAERARRLYRIDARGQPHL